MSAKKITNEIDNTLLIEWGTVSRSEAVEKHITTKVQKILNRAKDATHLVISLASDVSKNNHA
jgi:hypothetical protein